MKDQQRLAVYAWESAWATWNKNGTKRHNLRRWIRRAERKYRIPPTRIRFLERQHLSWRQVQIRSTYEPDEHRITLDWVGQNSAVALHEAAHAITDTLFGWDLEAHSRLWLGIYLWLLEDAKIAPRSALHASAKEFGLKWVPVEKVAPRVIRRFYAEQIERAEDNA